jgi:hypothetical protein
MERSGTSSLLRPFGWLIGAASILNLIQDLSLLTIKGALQSWLLAYDKVIGQTVDVVLAWLPWFGKLLTKNEAHIIILSLILASAHARALWIYHDHLQFNERLKTLLVALFIPFGCVFFAVITSERYPGTGLKFSAGFLLLMTAGLLFEKDDERDKELFSTTYLVRTEIVGVLGCSLVALVLSNVFLAS